MLRYQKIFIVISEVYVRLFTHPRVSCRFHALKMKTEKGCKMSTHTHIHTQKRQIQKNEKKGYKRYTFARLSGWLS